MFPFVFFQIIAVLLIVGVILWALPQIPIPAPFAQIIRVLIIVFVAIWLIWLLFGMAGGMTGAPFRR